MKKIIIIPILLILCYSLTPAQNNTTDSKDSIKNYWILGFGTGIGFINHPEFDEFLHSYGWEGKFRDIFPIITIEWGIRLHSTYIYWGLDIPFDNNHSDEEPISFNLNRFCVNMAIGYGINLNDKFEIMPNIGFGVSGNRFKYNKHDSLGNEIDFNDLLNENNYSFDVFGISNYYFFGLDFSKKFGLNFLTLSLQYSWMGENDWWVNQTTKINGIPDFKCGGFYLKFIFRPFINEEKGFYRH